MSFATNRVRLVGMALLAATFVVGALTGAAVERVLTAGERPAAVEKERRDRDKRSYVFEQIDGLTEEQRARIDGILEARRGQTRAVWDGVRPEIDAIIDSTRSEIEEVLTPEQREEYRVLLEEHRRKHKREGRGR